MILCVPHTSSMCTGFDWLLGGGRQQAMYTSTCLVYSSHTCPKKDNCSCNTYLGLGLSASRVNHDEGLVQVKMENQPRALALEGLRYFTPQALGAVTVLPLPVHDLTTRRPLSRQARRLGAHEPASPRFLQRRQKRTALISVCRAEVVCCARPGGPTNNSPCEHPGICRHTWSCRGGMGGAAL